MAPKLRRQENYLPKKSIDNASLTAFVETIDVKYASLTAAILQ